jgi:hypothetical protein
MRSKNESKTAQKPKLCESEKLSTIFYENSEFCDLQNFRTVFLKTWVEAQVLSEFDIWTFFLVCDIFANY